jgi:hypothetical protein
VRRWRLPRSVIWVLGFYVVLAACTALWWHWDDVGLSRLLIGTLLICVLLATGREVVWLHPAWMLLAPAAIIVAASFYYPLTPTEDVLALVFTANMLRLA